MADATVTPRIPLQTPMFDDAGNLTRPWILFFEQFGTPGADGAAGEPAVPPENVTFVSLVKATALDDQGNTYLHVTATYNPPTPDIGTFTGVHTYVEAPDQAIHDPADPRPDPIIVDVGEQQYLGDPAGTVVAPGYTRYGVIEYDFYPTKIEDWRFYLVPFSQFVENKLVPEQDPPDPDATPNKVISVAPGAVVPPGTEIPGNLIPIGVPPQPFLITVAVSDPDGNGLRRQVFTITYDPPDPVPPFTGVAVDIQTPGQVAAGEAFAAGNQEYSGDQTAVYPAVERRGSFQLNLEFAQHGGEHWTFYLSPYSATYRIPLDANKGAYVGTTANRSIIALSDAEGAPGIEWADQVLGLAVTVEYEYQAMVPGWKWRLNGTWTNPDDVRFGGSKQVIREYPAPTPDPSSEDRIPSYFGPQDDTYTTDWYDLADPQTFWDNFQVSIDILQRENSILVTDPAIPPASRVIPPDCPCVRVEVSEVLAIASLGLTRREGEEYASNVTGVSVLVHQVWDDIKGLWTYFITCKWTNPDPAVDPRFGGLDLVYRADGTEDIITPIFYQVDPGVPAGEQTVDLGLGDEWESPADDVPFTMFFRSFDFGGQDNSIVDGVTPAVDAIAFKSPAVGLITGFTMRVEYGDNGAVLINDPTFTPPADPAHPGEVDPSFWYAELWMCNPRWTGQLSEMGQSHDLAIIGENFPPGPASETWDYWGVSVSYDLRKNPDPFNPAVVTGTNHTTQIVGPAPEVGAPAPPGDVDFIDIAQNTTPLFDDQNNEYILVTIRYNPPNPIGTFTGVSVDVEAPDGSRIVVPDGDWDYFGDPAGTVIAPDYTRYGVVKLTFYPANDEDWRFYLSSYSPYVRNGLVFAVTPNLPLPVLAGSTAITPASPANVTFKTITQEVLVDANKDSYLHVVIQYDPPTPIGTFVGVDVDVEAPDQPTQPISKRVIVPIHGFDYNGNPTAGAGTISRMGTIDLTFYPAHHEFWRFYLSSYSSVVHNALVVYKEPTEDHDVTPFGLIEVFPAPIAAPAPAGYVNFISISSETLTDDEKNPYTHITIVYDQPTPVGTFMGVDVNVEAPDLSKIIIDVGSFDYSVHVVSGHGQIDLTFYPTKVETWRFYLTSYSSLVHNALILHGNMGETPNKPIPVSPGALPPGNITFPSTGAITQVTKTDLQHNDYIEVTILYIRPVPVGTFLGVDVDVEAPVNSKIIVPEGGWDYANNVDSSGQGKIILTFYPSKNETWQFYLSSYSMWVHNPLVMQGQPNPSPNIALTVSTAAVAPPELAALPALPSVVSGAQPGPAFRQQGLSNFMETKITATITFPNASHGATGVTIWISFDDGTTYEEAVNDKVGPGTSSNIDFWWTAPLTTNTKVRLKAVSWSPAGWNNPTSAVPSNPFTVNAPTPLTGSIITDAQQVGVITYAKAVDGSYRWGFKATWTNPPASNANFWTTNAYLRKVDGSGNPAPDSEGELREIGEFDVPGVLCTLAVSDTWGIPATPYVYRVYLKCADKLGVETPQNAWPTGAGWLQLNPVEQVGSTGTEYAPAVTLISGGATVTVLNDETGAQIYYLSGSFTGSTDPLYAGVSIMGSPSGGALEELDNKPRGMTQWRSASRPVPSAPETWTINFLSYNGDGRINTAGPTATVTVQRQTFGVGTEYAAYITAFTVTSNAPVISYTEGGQQQYHWTGTWQNLPADVKRKGVRIIARTPAPTGLGIMNVGSPTFTWSSGDQFTSDMVGKSITLDPASTPLTLNIVGYTSPTVITLSANGTAFQAHNFIVNNMAQDEELYLATEAETSFTSPDKPLSFAVKKFLIYAVSIDASNRQNTIVTGTGGTPVANGGNPITVQRLSGSAGTEFCPLVSGQSAQINYVTSEDGGVQWNVSGTFTGSSDPTYGGCVVYVRPASAGTSSATDTPVIDWTTGNFQGPNWSVGASQDYYVYFVSYDKNTLSNTIVPGTTPRSGPFTVARPTGGTGATNAPLVIFTLRTAAPTNPGGYPNNVLSFVDDAGIVNWFVSGTVAFPKVGAVVDPKLGGVKIVRMSENPVVHPENWIEMCDLPASSPAVTDPTNGAVGEYWFRSTFFPPVVLANPLIVALLSYDTSGRINTYVAGVTPQFGVSVPPQSQTIKITKADPADLVTASLAAGMRGPRIVTNIPDSSVGFPGPNWPAGSYAYVTSLNALYKTATGAAGDWQQAVNTPDIVANSITGGLIQAAAIKTEHFVAQELLVGTSNSSGFYNGPTKFRVNDTVGNILAFIGDSTGTGAASPAYKGAYFQNIRVGATINAPFFLADNTQVAMGPNITTPNVLVNSSGVLLQNTPMTINAGTGVVINTNAVKTSLNNETVSTPTGTLTFGFYTQDTGLNNRVLIDTAHVYLQKKSVDGQQRQSITLDGNTSTMYLFDRDTAQPPGSAIQKFSVEAQTPGQPALIKVHTGATLQTAISPRVLYCAPTSPTTFATYHMSFAAGILYESAAGSLTQEELAAGMVEPPSWFELMEERVAALEAALKGRNN